ncbi:kinase-like protein [Aureobasidium sp. EXF-12298]|nr:kinase-like protein [Aureobasidium sp. EXF-12298]
MASHRTPAGHSRREAPVVEIAVGDFIRKNEIGKGSFATVYLASHRKRKSYAAIKSVVTGKLTGKLRENLNSEINILRKLQHPHIVALFECVDTPQHIHLVMEYCQMSDLAAFMKGRARIAGLPETRDIFDRYPNATNGGLHEVLARHFLKQIASALQYLRKYNLIHRDIKPQNLLLNPPPTYMQQQRPEDVPLAASENSLIPAVGVASLPMLKLADFGFARHLASTSLAETLCGSPLYMAPEILAYQKYDAKADLWSVGTVAYEMVAGRPPFKATNHVELLRKIEAAQDVIQFPAGLVVSREFKDTIKSLLKRQPTQRVSFDRFFGSSTIVGEIPGLVDEDKPRVADTSESDIAMSALSLRLQQQSINSPEQEIETVGGGRAVRDPPPGMTRRPTAATASPSIEPTKRPEMPINRRQTEAAVPSAASVDTKRYAVQVEHKRPPLIPTATAPSRQELQQAAPLNHGRASNPRYVPSPSSSAPQTSHMNDKMSRQSRDANTAHDLTFEKEYVMVEKKAVEVNAFADELADRNRQPENNISGMTRRTPTRGVPGANVVSNAIKAVSGRQTGTLPGRRPSFDLRGQVPTHTDFITKALNLANDRLRSAWNGLPQGVSPPQGYAGFPASSAPPLQLTMGDGRNSPSNIDEDTRLVQIVEEGATRSDVVYGFAEVKYRQLLPPTPSTDDRAMIRQISALEQPLNIGEDANDQNLTQVAIVALAEEAFVLYVKALAILVKTINLVKQWWERQRRYDTPPGSLPSRLNDTKQSSFEISKKMNNVVQWARTRFNESLEKSELVGRLLIEAQKQLPTSHPGHPSNHGQSQTSGTGNTTTAAVDQIQLTSGITAEKLMLDRAVEMSRAAAQDELKGINFGDCELSYITSVMLLEAVLENDDEPVLSKQSSYKARAGVTINGMNTEDCDRVLKLIEGVRGRLDSLRRKLRQQIASSQAASASTTRPMARTSSSPGTAMGTPPR